MAPYQQHQIVTSGLDFKGCTQARGLAERAKAPHSIQSDRFSESCFGRPQVLINHPDLLKATGTKNFHAHQID